MNKFWAILPIFICILFLTSCQNEDNYSFYEDEDEQLLSEISKLEDRVAELEYENDELKEKLENINLSASSRDYNYSDLLDDIEMESDF